MGTQSPVSLPGYQPLALTWLISTTAWTPIDLIYCCRENGLVSTGLFIVTQVYISVCTVKIAWFDYCLSVRPSVHPSLPQSHSVYLPPSVHAVSYSIYLSLHHLFISNEITFIINQPMSHKEILNLMSAPRWQHPRFISPSCYNKQAMEMDLKMP